MGRKSKNSVRSELVARETSLPFSWHVLDVAVDLFQIGRLAALARAVVNDFDLQFLGRLIDDRHSVLVIAFEPTRRRSVLSAASGSACPGRPRTAR